MSQVQQARKSGFYKLYRALRKSRHFPRAYFEILSTLFRNRADWTCINYGYKPLGGPELALEPRDESERYPLQLYHLVASGAELNGRDVLEISSGRGGGASFVARYHRPRSYTGMDIAASAVRFCKRQHQVPGLTFVQGDAMALPMADASFDAVLSVEASHNYTDRAHVFRQIHRLLRPGGYFLYTDVLTHSLYLKAVGFLRESGFEILKDEVISPEVLASMQAEDARKLRMIESCMPGFLNRFARFCVGTTDSYPYLKIKEGESTYFRVVARRLEPVTSG
ncbi:MAG: class I SAM-dependent methyltransferase [Verrucomicrobia bacterium]|nr:class I SAM-dependent methyltransferase [Verrucomicrobiota bacterium]